MGTQFRRISLLLFMKESIKLGRHGFLHNLTFRTENTMTATMTNISSYKFVSLPQDQLEFLRAELLSYTRENGLKGSILLATEGINLFVSGTQEQIQAFHNKLTSYDYFKDIQFKESPSEQAPFKRMLVKIKSEIIKMGIPTIEPEKFTAPYLAPEMLKQWYEEGREMIILDTRNDYEITAGTFKNAIDLNIRKFTQFPGALEKISDLKNSEVPIVTLCTGGIRCEKAAALMLKEGFNQVYQLDGGILKYFEKCGGNYYDGECFVFDKRITVDNNLGETKTIQCNACRAPILAEEQETCNGLCPFCQDDGISDRVHNASNVTYDTQKQN